MCLLHVSLKKNNNTAHMLIKKITHVVLFFSAWITPKWPDNGQIISDKGFHGVLSGHLGVIHVGKKAKHVIFLSVYGQRGIYVLSV